MVTGMAGSGCLERPQQSAQLAALGTRRGWHTTAMPAASVVTGDAGARGVLTRRVGTASRRAAASAATPSAAGAA